MEHSVLQALMSQLLKLITFWNVVLVLGNWTAIHALRQGLWPFFEKNNGLPGWRRHGWRLKFFLPIGGCIVPACFVPGPWIDPQALMGEKFALGLVLGGATIAFHHLVKSFGADSLIAAVVRKNRRANRDD